MLKQDLVILILLFIAGLFKPGFGQFSQDSIDNYNESLEKFRNGKNIKLMYSESTPLTPEQHENFKGLNYFKPDISYQLTATLITIENPDTVKLRTSTERAPEYIKYGKLLFSYQDHQYELIAYRSKKLLDVTPGENTLFVPFRDETSGEETYGGGRYVDVDIPVTGNTILLDFNKAYNPYCAYNPRYSCVIPPEDNRLPVRIEAGEKVFEKH